MHSFRCNLISIERTQKRIGQFCFQNVFHYGLNDELENMQKRAARFVTRNFSYETGSMTGILEELKWDTLQKRRKDNRLIIMYKGLKG